MHLYKGIIKDIVYTVLAEEVGKGRYLQLFEEEFAKYTGTKYAITICSKREGLSAVAEFRKKKTGSSGKAGIFDLETDSLINAFGGCMITTDDAELAQCIRDRVKVLNSNSPKFPSSLRILKKIFMNFLKDSWLGYFKCVSKNAGMECTRFTNLQALIGIKQLRLLDIRNNQLPGLPTTEILPPAGKN
ncbi:MAG: DegT/DnrJ/EryC1/StrS family aminotransferase [Candidatus Omnitrophica bacterium]|nr:DegT/DnrJ/EryC1/StrS family aminotransferase [Candidatus Omnitrophota bacterium]